MIHGDFGNIDEGMLEIYFENNRRSGGGDLERIDLRVNPPVLIFCNAEG